MCIRDRHRIINHCLILIGFWAACVGGIAHANDSASLGDPLGTHRLLVLCLLENSNQTTDIYKSMDWENFVERDLYYIELRPDAAYTVKPDANLKLSHIMHRSDKALRAEANCKNDFEFVLIGNDGTQKRRWAGLPSSQELFATIDAMPFRRFEMIQKARER